MLEVFRIAHSNYFICHQIASAKYYLSNNGVSIIIFERNMKACKNKVNGNNQSITRIEWQLYNFQRFYNLLISSLSKGKSITKKGEVGRKL